MSSHQLHHKCISRRVYSDSLRQLLGKCDGRWKANKPWALGEFCGEDLNEKETEIWCQTSSWRSLEGCWFDLISKICDVIHKETSFVDFIQRTASISKFSNVIKWFFANQKASNKSFLYLLHIPLCSTHFLLIFNPHRIQPVKKITIDCALSRIHKLTSS